MAEAATAVDTKDVKPSFILTALHGRVVRRLKTAYRPRPKSSVRGSRKMCGVQGAVNASQAFKSASVHDDTWSSRAIKTWKRTGAGCTHRNDICTSLTRTRRPKKVGPADPRAKMDVGRESRAI